MGPKSIIILSLPFQVQAFPAKKPWERSTFSHIQQSIFNSFKQDSNSRTVYWQNTSIPKNNIQQNKIQPSSPRQITEPKIQKFKNHNISSMLSKERELYKHWPLKQNKENHKEITLEIEIMLESLHLKESNT